MEKNNLISSFRIVIFVVLICVLPLFASKFIKIFKNKNQDYIGKNEFNREIEKYIKNNSELVLKTLLNKYFEMKQNEKSNNELNNSIWLFENELFDQNLPKFESNKEIDPKNDSRPRILIMFTDFDSILPIFNDLFNLNPEKLNARIFFRQIVTQSKYSLNLALNGIAISKIKKDAFLPFYIDILSIPKNELTKEKIDSITSSFGIDLKAINEITSSKEMSQIVKRSGQIALEMGIKDLPAFIMENGQVFFGNAGLKIIRNLYNQEEVKN
jgi:hypothetical protein